jgi:hypothetical protein
MGARGASLSDSMAIQPTNRESTVWDIPACGVLLIKTHESAIAHLFKTFLIYAVFCPRSSSEPMLAN